MKYERNHNLSVRLYKSKIFTLIYDKIAGKFAKAFLWNDLSTNFLNHIQDGGTILEIGAGSGLQAINNLELRPDLKIIASDFSQQMLSMAKENLIEEAAQNDKIAINQGNLSFVEANVMDLSQFKSQKFDGIYSMGAIKHFPEPLLALHQCINVLQSGGMMYFTDFCSDGSYFGTREIGKKLEIPFFLKFIILPIIHFGIKKEAPCKDEVESWRSELENSGTLRTVYSEGNSIFALIFTKNK